MAKSIFQQTGWQRPHPNMILQDQKTLLKITEYDFDLDDSEFLRYFTMRTGIYYFDRSPVFLKDDPETEEKINRLLKGRLQDAWELYSQRKEVSHEISSY